jgi:hypothetical protein
MNQTVRFARLAFAILLLGIPLSAEPILIDDPPPSQLAGDPPSPWHSLAGQPIITFALMTSWDGIIWSGEMTQAALDSISYLDQDGLPYNSLAQGNTDFTMRWGGTDFFKDWRSAGKYSAAGWNLTNALAVAYKHNNGPWDPVKYPNNEIYFNTGYTWSFGLSSVDPNGYDFWTVLQHEVIHMLACDSHAVHDDEVMYPTVAKGVRKYLQDSDKKILSDAGYSPEPGTLGLAASALVLLLIAMRRRSQIQ